MKCLIFALDGEAAPAKEKAKILSEETIFDLEVKKCDLCGETVYIIVCGVGKVNAARAAQYAISSLGATEIINIGTAGALKKDMKVGEIYEIESACQYDFDLCDLNGTAIGTLNEFTSNLIPLKSDGIYPKAIAGSADRFNDDELDFKVLTEIVGASIRDMECAAIAQVCVHAGVPFRAFKVVSDIAKSGSTTEQYLANLDVCYKKIGAEIGRMLGAKS